MTEQYLKSKKVGFVGTGNMGQAIIRALINSGKVPASNIFATNRTPGKLQKLVDQLGVNPVNSIEELLDRSDIVILGIKPQDFYAAIEPIASSFGPQHIVVSLLAGVSIKSLQKVMRNVKILIRAMPNTAATINKSVVGYCLAESAKGMDGLAEDLLSPLGFVVQVEEGEEFEALTVSCSSGIGFVFELMIYWQEWLEEHGFDAETARAMTVKTFLGASLLADQAEGTSLQDLQNRVVSKKGVTAAGLDSMGELEVERAIRYSFEKAVLRDRELGQTSV
ncbi:MAG: pyrroline-5-carboxylate reductase [Bdellovibrionaceae bacterium]|nr:pyrroline-5-carboxylate reductase [Bdellovibrionales bacterium]MCB9086396.1 pyrroline-5-carboxylate reductase [Pseudobdellovibrionaceae bacterium]